LTKPQGEITKKKRGSNLEKRQGSETKIGAKTKALAAQGKYPGDRRGNANTICIWRESEGLESIKPSG